MQVPVQMPLMPTTRPSAVKPVFLLARSVRLLTTAPPVFLTTASLNPTRLVLPTVQTDTFLRLSTHPLCALCAPHPV